MSKEQNSQEENKALHKGGVVSSYLIKFNEIDSDGNMYLPNSINLDNLSQLKIKGQIMDYEIDEKVIKVFRIDSASL